MPQELSQKRVRVPPAATCRPGRALPQGSQVPQLYAVPGGCGGKKVINLVLLGRE